MPPASTALPSPSQVQAAKPAGNKSAGTYPDPTYRVVRMGIYADVGYCNAYPQWNLQLLYLVQQLNAILNGQISGMAMVVAGPTCISGSDQWGNDPGTFMSYFTSWCGTDTGCKNADYAQLGTPRTHGMTAMAISYWARPMSSPASYLGSRWTPGRGSREP